MTNYDNESLSWISRCLGGDARKF